jgi:hypothetical protein
MSMELRMTLSGNGRRTRLLELVAAIVNRIIGFCATPLSGREKKRDP